MARAWQDHAQKTAMLSRVLSLGRLSLPRRLMLAMDRERGSQPRPGLRGRTLPSEGGEAFPDLGPRPAELSGSASPSWSVGVRAL